MASYLAMQLTFPQPFDLASSLESGQAHRWQREGQWYIGVIHGNLIKIRQDLFGVEFRSAPNMEETVVPMLYNYFRLEENLENIYRQINKDSRVASVINQYRGMRILRQEPWECMVAFICSANSNIPRIASNMETLAESFGEPITLDETIRYSFPTPFRLAWAGEIVLRNLGLGFRAPYVARATEAVASGALDLEALRRLPYQEAKVKLMEVPGIGSKVADCILVFSLDKLEAFPIDVWVRRALREWYFGGEKVPDSALLKWAQEYFGPYAGYAQQYLFHGRRMEK